MVNKEQIQKDSWQFHYGDIIQFPIPENISLPIYVIGDSHVRILVDAAPYIFKSSQVDIEDVFISKTAYAIGDEKYLNDAINNISEGSNVLLSFGEIDCRHYIPQRVIENDSTIEEEVELVANRYLDNCVKVLREKFNVILMGLYICPDDHTHENDYYDISTAKLIFHSTLKRYAMKEGLVYVPLFPKVLNEGWDILDIDYPHYFNDSSHLGACMIPIILDSISKHEHT